MFARLFPICRDVSLDFPNHSNFVCWTQINYGIQYINNAFGVATSEKFSTENFLSFPLIFPVLSLLF